MAATRLIGIYASGTDFQFTFTLKTDGVADDLSAALSVDARIKHRGRDVLSLKALEEVTAADGIMRLVVLDTESDDWQDGEYEGDVLAVLSDGTKRSYGPFIFNVRRKIA